MQNHDFFEISNKALKLRQEFGEDAFSPIDIFALIKNAGNITLIMHPLGEHVSGYCRKYEHTNIVVVNSSMTAGRQRFSLAHELYHIYFDETTTSFICSNFNNKAVNEQKADLFASFFLMPQTALSKFGLTKPVSINDIVKIEQFYRISRKAALYRLLNEGLIDENDLEKYSHDVKLSAKKLGYDDSLYIPSPEKEKYFVYGNYIVTATWLLDNDKISAGKYEEYLLDAYRDDLVYGFTDGGEIVD